MKHHACVRSIQWYVCDTRTHDRRKGDEVEKKLDRFEWRKLDRLFREHLNSFDPEHPLPEDYFYDHVVHSDVEVMGMYRYLLIEMIPDDEGGSSMLYLHTDVDNIERIEFAAWTFDTATIVWKMDKGQAHSFDTGGWDKGNHPEVN